MSVRVTLGKSFRRKIPAYSLLRKKRRFQRTKNQVLAKCRKLEKALAKKAKNETCFLACGDVPENLSS